MFSDKESEPILLDVPKNYADSNRQHDRYRVHWNFESAVMPGGNIYKEVFVVARNLERSRSYAAGSHCASNNGWQQLNRQ